MNNNFVNGVNLQRVADIVIDVLRKDDVRNLTRNCIIWCKTDFLSELFSALENDMNEHVLITHCSDHSIDKDLFNSRPKCIKTWHAQNVNYQHKDLIPLPIGIENHEGPNKGGSIDIDYLLNNRNNYNITNKIINKLYCNFNPQTNSNRVNVANIITNKGLASFDINKPFSDYCESMKQFLFVASPRGNGIDCHRTWEALYMGCIPIVERHFMYDSYKNLPIIQIDSWDELSIETLTPFIQKYKTSNCFNHIHELDLTFYLNKIKNTLNI